MRMKLSVKISLLVVLAATAAGMAVALVDYQRASHEMRLAAEDKLLAVLQARTDAIKNYLLYVQRDLRSLAANPDLISSMSGLAIAYEQLGDDREEILRALYRGVDTDPRADPAASQIGERASTYSWWHDRFHPAISSAVDRNEYRDLLLLDLEGNIVYSTKKKEDFATNVISGAFKGTGIAKAFQQALRNKATSKQVFVDFAKYSPNGDEPTGFTAVVVTDRIHEPIGVLAVELPTTRIDEVMGAAAGLGLTGETIIVGSDLMLRGASRLESTAGIMSQRVSIDALVGAMAGEAGIVVSPETRPDGSVADVLVAFQPLDFLGTRWVIAAKMDIEEVDAPVNAMRDSAILSGGAIALMVALAGIAIAQLTVVGPLNEVIRALRLLTDGNRRAPLQLRSRSDEIGDIGRALALYRNRLIERDLLDAENRREAALIDAGRRFRLIAEAQPHPVVVADALDWTIRYANPAAVTLLDLSAGEAETPNFGSVLADPFELENIAPKDGERSTDDYVTSLLRPDGTEIHVSMSARALDYDGTPSLVIGIVDLTEQEAAQAEIERQREMLHQGEKLGALGSLLAGIAHELNNPLSIVVGQATIFEDLSSDPDSAARGTKIRIAAERCARIVKTFLSMARQRPEARASVDLNDAIKGALDLLGYGLRTSAIDIRCNLAKDLPPLWADSDQISQIVTNLILNAQQAMTEWDGERRLTITTAADKRPGMVLLSVADTGPGVSAGIRSRIFEPFFTTKPVGEGTGIGLSVCHGMVTSHGGTIEVDDAPGGGARFLVRLPTGPALLVAQDNDEKPRVLIGRRRALVVDDEPGVAETLREMLEKLGFSVDIEERARTALSRILTGNFEIVLSDIRMPDMDGMTFYRELKRLRPPLADRFVVVTGDTMSGRVKKFIGENRLVSLEKPFGPDDVRLAIEKAVGKTLRRRLAVDGQVREVR